MFQYKLIFKLEKNCLPRASDKVFVSFLKASAQQSAAEFYKQLYDKSRSVLKSYTFACYLPGARFEKEQILLDTNEFAMFFSAADSEELLRFFNGFQKMKYKNYPMNGNSMQLVSVRMQQLHQIHENEIVIKMQSPLIVRRHHTENNTDHYYTYEMEDFGTALKENIDFFLQTSGLDISTEDFSIQTVKGKKVVIPVFGRNTDASLGVFKLTGNCQLLNLLYMAGMGARRSCGHGKFLVIH